MLDKHQPIIALDFASVQDAKDFLTKMPKHQPLNLKIGMELYYLSGSEFVKSLVDQGHQIFLDLKLHDIPNTVERSMRILAQLGIAMVNVHAAGGQEMMTAAKEGLLSANIQSQPLLIAVTQLTSTSHEQLTTEQLISSSMEDCVQHYARLALQAGLDGVVCSPQEAHLIKEVTHSHFLTVTPGIRSQHVPHTDDQKRTLDIASAIRNKCDFLVIGRPITRSNDPEQVYQQAVKMILQTRKEIDNA